MNLETQVRQVFSSTGQLAQSVSDFLPRDAQTDMAAAVAKAIEESHALVVEAGTGVGKTFSYLVPALLSGERVMLSTATKALQDQLFERDLPRLVEVLGLPTRTALLKGRGSYLCIHRMEQARHDVTMTDRLAQRTLGKIEQWAQATRTGDLAELPGLDERSSLIPLVTSTRENCLGQQCPQFRDCHVNNARRAALAADVVVINHHLFFADLAVKESGVAELLPSVRIAIFDEAHQLNETGVNFLGKNLTTGQLIDFSRDLLATGLQLARGLADWSAVAGVVDRAARDLRLCAHDAYPGSKLRWVGAAPEGLQAPAWQQGLAGVSSACDKAIEALELVTETAPDFLKLHERALQLSALAQSFVSKCQEGCVRWLDVGMQLRLIESPLDIAKTLQSKVFGAEKSGALSWIFASATLGDDDTLAWFTGPCGLEQAQVLRVGSPFDYERQAAVYVPPNFPKPSDPTHTAQVAQLAVRAARRLGGRTMVLTTTLRALRCIGEVLQAALGESGQLDVLVQGAMPKRALIERFRRGNEAGERGCVLVASASFWEGIDVPGEALQLVIIDKLPFPPPNDPIVQARSERLEAQGKSSFNEYFLPEAAVALKQGAGRLIRKETDQGVLVLCDSRLVAMSYGRRLLRALPPMRRLSNEAELNDRLDSLCGMSVSAG